MSMQKVNAIVRVSALETIEQALKDAGVGGLTIRRVRGFGAYRNFFRGDWTHRYAQIEIFSARARTIADLIVDAANTGQTGDGIVAIEPVDSLIRIRDRTSVSEDEG